MKTAASFHFLLIATLMLLLTIIFPIAAYPDTSWQAQTEFRIMPSDSGKERSLSFIQTKLDHAFGANAAFSSRLRLYYHASLSKFSTDESGKTEIEIKDLYLDLFNIPFNEVEIRIGKQRINTGKSDFFRHLDVINPPDLSNPIAFDERVPSMLIKFKWNIGFDTAFEIFTGPGLITAKYPYKEDENEPFKKQINTTTGLSCNFIEEKNLPDAKLKHWIAGVRFSTKIGRFDFTLLAVTHNIPILLANQISITTSSSSCSINYSTQREQIIGIGMAGEILGLGIRAEIAAHKSDSFFSKTYIDTLLAENRSIITDKLYLTGSFGFDYQFKNGGPYLNMEFSHGFLGEFRDNSGNGINQYAVLSVEQKFNKDRIKISLSLGVELDTLDSADNWQELKKGSAWFSMLGITFSIHENIELECGGFWANGADDTTLGKPELASLVYLKLTAKM